MSALCSRMYQDQRPDESVNLHFYPNAINSVVIGRITMNEAPFLEKSTSVRTSSSRVAFGRYSW